MNRRKDISRWFLCFFVVLFSTTTLAARNDCQPPNAPKLPTAVTDKIELDALSAKVEKYLAASADHLACLAAFADRNHGSLTDQEKADLKSQFSAQRQKTRNHTTQADEAARVYAETQSKN